VERKYEAMGQLEPLRRDDLALTSRGENDDLLRALGLTGIPFQLPTFKDEIPVPSNVMTTQRLAGVTAETNSNILQSKKRKAEEIEALDLTGDD
jgi:hypothetical protein